jgi:hypothetical protein
VELTIITKPFMAGGDFKRQMQSWAERRARERHHADSLISEQQAQDRAQSQAIDTPPQQQRMQSQPGQPHIKVVRHAHDKLNVGSAGGVGAPSPPPLPPPPPPPPPSPAPFAFNTSALPKLYVVHHHIQDADLPRQALGMVVATLVRSLRKCTMLQQLVM